MTIILTIAITLLARTLLPASVDKWASANRRTTVILLAAVAMLAGGLALATSGGGDVPVTPALLQQAARAAEADGGGYDYSCQLYGAPRQIICQGQDASVASSSHPAASCNPNREPANERAARDDPQQPEVASRA